MKHIDAESWSHIKRSYRALGTLASLPPPEGITVSQLREMARELLSEIPESLIEAFEED